MDLSHTFGVIYWGFIIATAPIDNSAFLRSITLLPCETPSLSCSDARSINDAIEQVVNFGNPLALLYMTKPYVTEYAITLIIIFLSQTFYLWQIYTVNRTVWIPLLIFFLATCSLAGGIAVTVELFKVDLLVENLSDSTIMICLSLATSFAAACEIVSTAAMCYYLAFRRSTYKE
ncbi:hypothetical protein A7U60_g1437 [Sanghuangporus baumii]|uniref:Uncharacterized protein n=1 Tax=Sanghuangporus baumii TaxID=108892 RepID=A0A9Q5I441_SANBA|nr:hypothetical protein A7U60_g1437 [Sanghuangporus baumii]